MSAGRSIDTPARSIVPTAAAGRSARRGLLAVALGALLLLGAGFALGAPPGPHQAPHRLLVGVRPTMRPTQVSALEATTGGVVRRKLARGRVLVVDLPPGADLHAAKVKALMDPSVLFVEPDGMIYPTLVPDDPEYPQQYHLPLIRAPEAWDVTTTSPDVVIAVVDTGVDLDHPDLAAQIYTNPGEVPGNSIDDDGNGFVDDVHGWDFVNDTPDANPEPDGVDDDGNGTRDDQVSHGTLVSGLAASVGNDGFGTAGVTWRVQILPIQVFPDDGGASVSQVIEGIDYAIDMGADIINLSVGGDYFESFSAPIAQAYEAGILVVAAAGNTGGELTDSPSTWESPVCNDGPNLGVDNHVLGVGSTDRNDVRASFSNYDGSSGRTFVDCMAPGEGMYGPGYYDPGFPDFGSYYDTNSGTSFSVPLVSGLAALLLGQNPGMGPGELIATIGDGCDNIDALNPGFAGKLGRGRINCARSLGIELRPRPPRDLSAQDTEGDEGGSITLEWQTSLDDGAGSNSVTEYVILRRRGSAGEFAEIARVPAGTTQYLDTSVTDGTSYFYRVLATSATLSSDPVTVGPVQSANDNPPPAVQGVYAEDRPADDGGAIRVGWDPYAAPADFDVFAVYRAPRSFNSVTLIQRIAEVSDPEASEYLDVTTTDGVDYYYAVTAVDVHGNEHTDVTPFGPVQSLANGPMTLQAGMYFLGSPLEPADREPTTLFQLAPGELRMARYSQPLGDYTVYSGPGTLPLRLGRGYWLKLDEDLTFTPAGNLAPSGSLSIELDPGWHQLANAYVGPMDMMAATVCYQGTTMDLASAAAANVIREVLWTYDPATNGYELVAPFLHIGDSAIQPWEGFWVRVEKPCSLTLPRPGSVVAIQSLAADIDETQDEWMAQLCARCVGGSDRDNYFGVSSRVGSAGALESPPPAPGGVDLYFLDSAAAGRRLAGIFAPTQRAEATWKLVIEAAPGQTVEVWCPDPGEIPRGYAVALCDEATGAVVDLRRQARHTIQLREGEWSRPMVLRLTQAAGALTLSSLSVEPTRAGGAQMSFTLSTAAECTVRVLNIAGRTIRVIERGRLRPAGSSQVLWDGRSEAGVAVPSGMYLVQVEAASDGGARTQAVRTLAIRR